jgi:hypothetical protein
MLRGRVGERDQVGLGLVERGGDVGETAGGEAVGDRNGYLG